MSFLCWWSQSWTQHSGWGLTRKGESSPFPCWSHCFCCSPEHNWLSGLQAHIARSCASSPPSAPPFLGRLLLICAPPSLCWYWSLPQSFCRTLHLAKLYEIPTGSFLGLVQVPLDSTLSLSASCTIQCGIICKAFGDVLNPFVYVIA